MPKVFANFNTREKRLFSTKFYKTKIYITPKVLISRDTMA